MPKLNRMLEYVEIETCSSCTRKCPWCLYGQIEGFADQPFEILETLYIEKILYELLENNFKGTISFYSMNEPMLDERIIDGKLFRLCKKIMGEAVKIKLNTNADLLTEQILKQMKESGLDFVSISCYDMDVLNKINPYVIQQKNYPRAASNVAYILFTSGTTGEPKGVEITHKGLALYLIEAYKNLEYENTRRHLSCCAYSFDVHFTEIFIPLFHGKTVVIANDEESHNPRLLMKLIEQHNVDTIWMTPSKMKWLITASRKVIFPTLQNIYLAGEVLEADLFEKLSHIKAQIWNAYGPTEATNYVTIKKIVDKNNITIGYPVPWAKIIICKQDFTKVNVGSIGEICIVSDTLSSGYCNNPEDTKKKFFSGQIGEKVYRTGDFGYQDHMGEIHFVGRMDRQIKLFGHRLELDGIEAHLNNLTNITQCGVYYNEDIQKLIILYAGFVQKEVVLEYLSSYMNIFSLPHCIAHVSEFAYNTNAKIDRQATYRCWLNEH